MTDTTDTETPPDNVVPEAEMARRRRVFELADDMADLIRDIAERGKEFGELGVPPVDWTHLVADRLGPTTARWVQKIPPMFFDMYEQMFKGGTEGLFSSIFAQVAGLGARRTHRDDVAAVAADLARSGAKIYTDDDRDVDREEFYAMDAMRMKKVMERLFAEAPKLTNADGTPKDDQAIALECFIVLKSGSQIQGALSTTPEGTLRMMATNAINGKPVMIEHFFDYDQVADLAVMREVKATEGSRIVTS